MPILAWNINGWSSKSRAVEKWFQFNAVSCDCAALIETHEVGNNIKLPGLRLVATAPACGRKGGVAVFAKQIQGYRVVSTYKNRGVCVDEKKSGVRILFVYGGFDRATNVPLENWIEEQLVAHRGDALIMGDLNKLQWDRAGWKDGFLDKGAGDMYTFKRGVSSSRPDRVLLTSGVKGATIHMEFPESRQKRISDHKPVLFYDELTKSSYRWIFPNWTLNIPSVREQILRLIDKYQAEGWWVIANRVRKYLPRIIRKSANEYPQIFSEAAKHRKLIFRKYRDEPGANPLVTSAVQKAMVRQSGSGSLNEYNVLSFYRKVYEGAAPPRPIRGAKPALNVTLPMVMSSIQSMRNNKTPGPSGLSAEFLKTFSDVLAPILQKEYENIICNEVDERWKRGVITLTPKKGDLTKVENWRPITLLNVEWKVFSNIVRSALEQICGEQVGAMQIGFRKGRWIQEHHLMLQALLQRHQNNVSAILLIDFQRAYDSLSHKFIVQRVRDLCGGDVADLIRKMLGGSSRIWLAGKFVGDISISRGVRQGDIISPLLFNLCLAKLLEKLDRKLTGLQMGDRRITHFAYADDLTVIIADDDRDRPRLKKLFHRWELSAGLCINVSKTMELRLKDSDVVVDWPIVHKASVLGIELDKCGEVQWSSILDRLYTRLDACRQVCSKQATLRQRVLTINSYALSVLPYVLKTDCTLDPHIDSIRAKIREALGSRGNVSWARLTAPVAEGGFGLIDPLDLEKRSKLSWRTYLWRSTTTTPFTAEVNRWSMAARRRAGTAVGPLLSWNSLEFYVDQWKSLARHMSDVRLYSKPAEVLCEWRYDDSRSVRRRIVSVSGDGESGTGADGKVWDMSGLITTGQDVYLLKSISKMRWRGQILYPSGSSNWKSGVTAAVNTAAQNRWETDGIHWRELWSNAQRNSDLSPKVKCWYLGALNVNLPVLYKKEQCQICGEVIGSGHFVYECRGLVPTRDWLSELVPVLKEQIAIDVMTAWIAWRTHCNLKHRPQTAAAWREKAVRSWYKRLSRRKALDD